MELSYVTQWEYNELADNYKDFLKDYNLVDTYYNRFRDQLTDWCDTKVTKKNMFKLLDEARYKGFFNSYDLLEGLAQQYIKDNDLFDQVFFIEFSDDENLYRVTFYSVVPRDQNDVKRFFEKHLDAYKNGFGEVVEEVIKKRSRNTPK